jgi:peptidoglycan/LPS O-acetylase OafA/YrhL
MKSVNSTYLPAVDHLRAFAAMLVLFQHCFTRIGGNLAYGKGAEKVAVPATTPVEAVLYEGHTGVSLFMVLSGFIFTHMAYGRRLQYGRFLLNRILRIYPLLLTVFMAGALVVGLDSPIRDTLAVLTIPFQMYGPGSFWFVPDLYPFTTLFWTIAPEFKFYLIFPLLLFGLNRYGAGLIVALIASAMILRVVIASFGVNAHDLAYWTIFGRIDQFLIGMLLAVYFLVKPAPRKFLLPAACVAVLAMQFSYNRAGGLEAEGTWKLFWPTVEALVWSAFILGYLQFASRLSAKISGALASIGEVSFSMYLLHVTVISAVMQLGPLSFGLPPMLAALVNAVILVMPLTLGVSFVTFRLIEQPFLRLRVRYVKGEPLPVVQKDEEPRRPLTAD